MASEGPGSGTEYPIPWGPCVAQHREEKDTIGGDLKGSLQRQRFTASRDHGNVNFREHADILEKIQDMTIKCSTRSRKKQKRLLLKNDENQR